ncbi:unnamed protein product, partial [Urochloa humidicola]
PPLPQQHRPRSRLLFLPLRPLPFSPGHRLPEITHAATATRSLLLISTPASPSQIRPHRHGQAPRLASHRAPAVGSRRPPLHPWASAQRSRRGSGGGKALLAPSASWRGSWRRGQVFLQRRQPPMLASATTRSIGSSNFGRSAVAVRHRAQSQGDGHVGLAWLRRRAKASRRRRRQLIAALTGDTADKFCI